MDKSKIIFAVIAVSVFVALNYGRPAIAWAMQRITGGGLPGSGGVAVVETPEAAFHSNVQLVEYFTGRNNKAGADAARAVTPFILLDASPDPEA